MAKESKSPTFQYLTTFKFTWKDTYWVVNDIEDMVQHIQDEFSLFMDQQFLEEGMAGKLWNMDHVIHMAKENQTVMLLEADDKSNMYKQPVPGFFHYWLNNLVTVCGHNLWNIAYKHYAKRDANGNMPKDSEDRADALMKKWLNKFA